VKSAAESVATLSEQASDDPFGVYRLEPRS
jgi:hypothetical protein